MCNLCGNKFNRTYTHSRNPYHLKQLKKLFREYKKIGYPWEKPVINVIPQWAL